MRLLLEGCYGYLLVPSLVTKHPCHQFSRHQFPCSSISDEFNNQPMGYIRCYAYFLNFAELTLFHIMADDKQKFRAFLEQEENRTLK